MLVVRCLPRDNHFLQLLMTIYTLVSLLVGFLIVALSVGMLSRDPVVSAFGSEAFLIGVALFVH